MSTKKTVDTEIVEDVEKIDPEVIEEVKEPVVDDVKEIVPEVKAPLRGISTPSMIHTHLDNFLAKLCGETPVDDDVRNSMEYWINELAEGNGGSTKKIYSHTINLYETSSTVKYILTFMLLSDSATAYTKTTLKTRLSSIPRLGPISGVLYKENIAYIPSYCYRNSTNVVVLVAMTTSGVADETSGMNNLIDGATYFTDTVVEVN